MHSALKFLQNKCIYNYYTYICQRSSGFSNTFTPFFLNPKKDTRPSLAVNYRNNYISLNIFGLFYEYKTKTTQVESTKPLFLGDTIFGKVNSSLNSSSKRAAFIKKLGKNSVHSF